MIEELTFYLADEPGALQSILEALAAADVNVQATVWVGGTISDFGVACLICEPTKQAMDVLRAENVRYQRRCVIAVGLEDKPGRLAKLTATLSTHNVNIRHIYHTEYRSPSGLPLTILSLNDTQRGIDALKGETEIVAELPRSSGHDERTK